MAARAYRLAREVGDADAVLDLVQLATQRGEVRVDPYGAVLLARQSLPQLLALPSREVLVGLVDGEALLIRETDEEVLPLLGDHAPPAGYGILVDRERGVGDH